MSILLDSVVLLFLAPWILLTLLAIYLGWKLGKKLSTKLFWRWFGAFLGFMFLMGGWIVWWRIEYLMNLRYAEEMCKEAGVEIYITPAQWIEMVGGEEEWKKMPYNFQSSLRLHNDIPETLEFQGKKYTLWGKNNERIFTYNFRKSKGYAGLSSLIHYDVLNKLVLYKDSMSFAGSGGFDSGSDGFKFWLDDLPECVPKESISVFDYIYQSTEDSL